MQEGEETEGITFGFMMSLVITRAQQDLRARYIDERRNETWFLTRRIRTAEP